ncbi:MAG: restriction endonuclease subunit S, partial [Pyrinomonadaceae bacterium]
MGNWKTTTLGDLVTFQRGHDLPKSQVVEGKYPIAGSNGIIGYHNEFTTKAPSITIGRSGNIGNPFFYETYFWAHNTTLYIKEFKSADPKFIYYLLKTLDFTGHNSGSAVPSLNRNFIHPLKVYVPDSIEEQKAIAKILSSLDDKIELNRQMNATLEAIARALFKAWFVDFEPARANMENRPSESASPEIAKLFPSEFENGIPKGWTFGTLSDI